MSMVWAIPAVAAVAAMGLLLLGLRSISVITTELRSQLEMLGAVRVAVTDLREERQRLQQTFEGLRPH